MRKLMKSRKALSPVVAAIILIAVTVAVSVAVAAWMGALTFTFMATEELRITELDYGTAGEIGVICNNTGTAKITIREIWVNNVKQNTWSSGSSDTVNPGSGETFTITYAFVAGNKYEVALVTASGNRFTYTGTAPL
jgi:flagellin-like protein